MDKESEMNNDWEAIEYERQFHIDHQESTIYIDFGINSNQN